MAPVMEVGCDWWVVYEVSQLSAPRLAGKIILLWMDADGNCP